ncbi:Tryptophan RNA-binding attenuator protein-like protein [Prunus dulcis]|uniref:Tryptophan RNA-binding attenuator protein-like protein n=1 Tax=Prunus dulcis TaxID=3755 RepID=A0A4Y1RG18_PRUDU|nr:Tryptophan RNA-binding attenuator protein-like protein [Prunus dulcis]
MPADHLPLLFRHGCTVFLDAFSALRSQQDDVVPFQILGGEAQMVQIMLKPEEKVIAKPGTMCFMSGSIEMENVFVPENEGGMWQWLFGKTVSSITFRNAGQGDGFVGLAHLLLQEFSRLIWLCLVERFCASDVKVSNTIDQRARNVIPGPEGFLRQKLSGRGLAFILGGGSVVQKNLEVGEVLSVDVSCIAAVTGTVNIQIKFNGTMRRALFGSDNLVTAVLTGPGIVFIQSLPFHRFSQRIARSVRSDN